MMNGEKMSLYIQVCKMHHIVYLDLMCTFQRKICVTGES